MAAEPPHHAHGRRPAAASGADVAQPTHNAII